MRPHPNNGVQFSSILDPFGSQRSAEPNALSVWNAGSPLLRTRSFPEQEGAWTGVFVWNPFLAYKEEWGSTSVPKCIALPRSRFRRITPESQTKVLIEPLNPEISNGKEESVRTAGNLGQAAESRPDPIQSKIQLQSTCVGWSRPRFCLADEPDNGPNAAAAGA